MLKEHCYHYKLTYAAYVTLWKETSDPNYDSLAREAIDMVIKREDCILVKVEIYDPAEES